MTRPERRDRGIYFAVGAFVGFLLGTLGVFGFTEGLWPERLQTVVLIGVVAAVICGVLAARFGEAFFEFFGGP